MVLKIREVPKKTKYAKIRNLNPHWNQGEIDPEIKGYRKRKYFDLFLPLAFETTVNRAVVLMGPRRIGKTIMLLQLIQHAIDSGYAPEKLVYFPLEDPLILGLPLEELINLYMESTSRDSIEGCIIIFDEIQYLPDWSIHLKVLVDNFRKTRFIASGSAAAALKLKSRESGAGRFTDFILPPLTFYEFLDLKNLIGEIVYEDHDALIPRDISELNSQFIDYINYGGYPEAVFNPEIQKNPERFIRGDIIEKVLLRDIPSLYGISNIPELTRFFNTLAFQTGNEITYDGLSQATGLAKNTVKKFIEYLEAAFLIKILLRLDNSGKRFKRVNYFKVYLTNPSMYTALFGLVSQSDEIGSLVETALFSQLTQIGEGISNIFYSRWKQGKNEGEVDFVILNPLHKIQFCLEVKWSNRHYHNIGLLKGAQYFSNRNNLEKITTTTKTEIGKKLLPKNIICTYIPASLYAVNSGYLILEQKQKDLSEVLDNLKIDHSFRLQ